MYKFFPERAWLFLVSKFKVFNRKDEFFSWSKEDVISFLAKVPILAFFGYVGTRSKSIFSTYRQDFEKSFVGFLEDVVRNIALLFELSIFSGLPGGGCPFCKSTFSKIMILARYKFLWRPVSACYACSIVYFGLL